VSSATINFPPLSGRTRLTQEHGELDLDAHLQLMKPFNGHPLMTVSTTGGSSNFPVPLAKLNQNVEITIVKTSADGNTPTLVPFPGSSDKFNSVGAWAAASYAMGTAQGSKVKIRSDGVTNWYIVG
jgi:hypothetical protein